MTVMARILDDATLHGPNLACRCSGIARLGGDEFAIVLPNTTCEVARQLAQRLRKAILEQFQGEPAVTLSVGVADRQPGMENGTTLFSEADRALYEAKRQGRDGVAVEC